MATSATSWLMNRRWWAALAGLAFGGKRNMYEIFGYPTKLGFEHLYAKYQRQDITARVVDMPPEETWANPPEVELPSSSQKWQEFVEKVGLWDRIIQADKLCNFGEYAILWLGLRGNQERAAQPIEKADDFLYVQAYVSDNAVVKEYQTNPSNERYGLPTMYDVRVGPDSDNRVVKVHYTRVVHIVDKPLQGLIFGEPRLRQVYNVLDDLLKITGGSAETFWLTANRGMQVDVDKDMELTQPDADALSDELDEFQHQLRRYVRTRGVSMKVLGSDVADPRGVFQTLVAILSGATSIPQRILVGSEAGQLASEQDRANWSAYIERRRKTFAEPYVLRPILRRLEDLQYIQKGEAQKAKFEWPEAFSTNPLEEALIRFSDARSVANYSRRNQYGNPIITDEEVRRNMNLPDKPDRGETLPDAPEQPQAQPPGSQPGTVTETGTSTGAGGGHGGQGDPAQREPVAARLSSGDNGSGSGNGEALPPSPTLPTSDLSVREKLVLLNDLPDQ